jgi:DNA-binding MarR family transcriptional regulator
VSETASPDRVAEALINGVTILKRRMRLVQSDGEVTIPERSALGKLSRGPATSAELARQEQISPQSMGATFASLESRGLVRREADPRDGRRIVLSVTAAGSDVLASRHNAQAERIAQALAADFTEAELEQLLAAGALLERLARQL